ncbi:DNA ligase [Achromobacter phage JWF]|uniref:DNA ligase n=1 Tax=Achromobacter phage JWF TaxID=1589748 RepID=UPI000588E128|nr:DNA ligase [Achromobacter phage JWF]AJD82943.1 DNA ligase [Achromobacter phage JWF]
MTVHRFVRFMQEAAATSSRIEKAEAFMRMGAAPSTAHELIFQALTPFVTFGVKDFDMPTEYAAENSKPIDLFFMLLDKLSDRELTGKAAKSEIIEILSMYTKDTAEALACVLRKNLRVGFGATEINKIIPGFIPVFNVMLAEKWLPGETEVPFPAMYELKFDGQRVTTLIKTTPRPGDGPILGFEMRSRDGLDQRKGWLGDMFDDQLDELRFFLGRGDDGGIVFDGEIMDQRLNPGGKSNTWNATMESKKEGADKSKLRYHLFDWIPLDQWNNGECLMNQEARSLRLLDAMEQMRKIYGDDLILRPSPVKWAHSHEELSAALKKAVADGYEGLMIKNAQGVYEYKRSKNWLKGKPLQTFDGEIYDIYEGKKNSALQGSLGGIHVRGVDEHGNHFDSKCGSGFDLATRVLWWRAGKDTVVGKRAVIEAIEITKDGSLKNPVFVRLHENQ